MKRFTFHLVGLPHLPVSKKYNSCAYTQKVYQFARYMTARGHKVYLYGCDGSDAPCHEFVSTMSTEDRQVLIPDYDWHKEMFKIEWDERKPYWALANSRAIVEIKKRIQPRDFVLIIGGTCQKPVADALPGYIAVEWGIGYQGIFSRYKVFESYAHMHKIYGSQHVDRDGDYYDCVIPNSFDPRDFPYGSGSGDYYLYIGRLIKRKGIGIANAVCRELGTKLFIAGQGVKEWDPTKQRLVTEEGETFEGSHVHYVGYADVAKRAQLMGEAKAVFVPTKYLGPFEGVNVEAQMTGTPVITTDFGCFNETVEHGLSGYRCHTHEQFVWAAKNAPSLDRNVIRERALRLYSTEKAAQMYEEFFYQLSNLVRSGFDEPNSGREELDWLKR